MCLYTHARGVLRQDHLPGDNVPKDGRLARARHPGLCALGAPMTSGDKEEMRPVLTPEQETPPAPSASAPSPTDSSVRSSALFTRSAARTSGLKEQGSLLAAVINSDFRLAGSPGRKLVPLHFRQPLSSQTPLPADRQRHSVAKNVRSGKGLGRHQNIPEFPTVCDQTN